MFESLRVVLMSGAAAGGGGGEGGGGIHDTQPDNAPENHTGLKQMFGSQND